MSLYLLVGQLSFLDTECVYVCKHVCTMHVCMYVCVHVFMCVCMYVLCMYILDVCIYVCMYVKIKGKGVPLQARCVPEVSRSFRPPDFHDIRHMKVVRLSTSRTGRLYSQECS